MADEARINEEFEPYLMPEGIIYHFPNGFNDPRPFFNILCEISKKNNYFTLHIGLLKGPAAHLATVFGPIGSLLGFKEELRENAGLLFDQTGLRASQVKPQSTFSNVAEPGATLGDTSAYKRLTDKILNGDLTLIDSYPEPEYEDDPDEEEIHEQNHLPDPSTRGRVLVQEQFIETTRTKRFSSSSLSLLVVVLVAIGLGVFFFGSNFQLWENQEANFSTSDNEETKRPPINKEEQIILRREKEKKAFKKQLNDLFTKEGQVKFEKARKVLGEQNDRGFYRSFKKDGSFYHNGLNTSYEIFSRIYQLLLDEQYSEVTEPLEKALKAIDPVWADTVTKCKDFNSQVEVYQKSGHQKKLTKARNALVDYGIVKDEAVYVTDRLVELLQIFLRYGHPDLKLQAIGRMRQMTPELSDDMIKKFIVMVDNSVAFESEVTVVKDLKGLKELLDNHHVHNKR